MPETVYNRIHKRHMSETTREVSMMPGRDKTGPFGAGEMTGRGLGPCAGAGDFAKRTGFGPGMACRRGFGRGFRGFFADGGTTEKNRRESLRARKTALENRIAAIDRRLESL